MTSTKTCRWKAKFCETDMTRMTRITRKMRNTRMTRMHCTMTCTFVSKFCRPLMSQVTMAGTTVTKSRIDTSEKKKRSESRAM